MPDYLNPNSTGRVMRLRCQVVSNNYRAASEAELLTRYILVDEEGQQQFPPVNVYGFGLAFELLPETPEAAWKLIDPAPEGVTILPPDTPLFVYRIKMKNTEILNYTADEKRMPGSVWFAVDTIQGKSVMVAMSEVQRFEVTEI
jgi:hypothetical protein